MSTKLYATRKDQYDVADNISNELQVEDNYVDDQFKKNYPSPPQSEGSGDDHSDIEQEEKILDKVLQKKNFLKSTMIKGYELLNKNS